MAHLLRFGEGRARLIGWRQTISAAILLLFCFAVLPSFGQRDSSTAPNPAAKSGPMIEEELILKNGDRLTGHLLNSTGTEIHFQTHLEGEVTVRWQDIKKLNSQRTFAVIPKKIRNARNSKLVPEGTIDIRDKGVVLHPARAAVAPNAISTAPEIDNLQEASQNKNIPLSSIGFLVDDATYQKEIHRRIGWQSGWEGHLTTGSTMVVSTQKSYLFHMSAALTRTVPTVIWLNPQLRTKLNFRLTAGRATQPDTPVSITNIYHADAERDKYFGPHYYFLQIFSLDHNDSQGLSLEQNYGAGVGSTVFRRKNSELDVAMNLHYANQQFDATADVSQFDLNLIGTSLSEALTRRWGKIHWNEKLIADVAFNNASAFSASGVSSIRLPVYKRLGFNAAVIDNLLNNPQVGFQKNSLQFTTGFSWSLH